MAKPTILAVDDDAQVLNAVYSDLRCRFADRYRIVRADTSTSAEVIQRFRREKH